MALRTVRNLNYDFLRLMGLFIIMVAHSAPPGWIHQLRNFGTPLLVVGSALTYSLILKNSNLHVRKFYRRRLLRLVLPAWIFLSIFFLFFFCVSLVLDRDFPFRFQKVIGAYTFQNGIGFLWVFKIYIILALVTPLAKYFQGRDNRNRVYFSVLIGVYVLYEIIVASSASRLSGFVEQLFNSWIFIAIPYTLLYFYGFRLSGLKGLHVLCISLMAFLIFTVLCYLKYVEYGYFVPTQQSKYPPTLYYLSYAFFSVNLVYLIVMRIEVLSSKVQKCVVWLSGNSLWLYLWHIMAYYLWMFVMPPTQQQMLSFICKLIFLLGFSVMCVLVQNWLVGKLLMSRFPWRYHLAPYLTGALKTDFNLKR